MMGLQQHSHNFLFHLLIIFITGIVVCGHLTTHRNRVRRQSMKVRISATEDTIVMKFLRPNAETKLEGYILGYGSSMFSKQFIQLPENGTSYEKEFDAEPKYLIAVQPIPTNEVKKQCTGKVELEKPLHLVIGSVTPTSVLLSWGTLLKTPYEVNIMDDCLEDGHYTVRYRERNRNWNYQTCPTRDTVIDNLKPNAVYEFGVQPNSKEGTGIWSKPVIHNISTGAIEAKVVRKILKRPNDYVKPSPHISPTFTVGPPHVLHNKSQGSVPISQNIRVATSSKKQSTTTTTTTTTLAPTTSTTQESVSTPGPTVPVVTKQPIAPTTSTTRESVSTPGPTVPVVTKRPIAPTTSTTRESVSTPGPTVPVVTKRPIAPTTSTTRESVSTPGPTVPVVTKRPIGEDIPRSVLLPFLEVSLAPNLLPSPLEITATMAYLPVPQTIVEKHEEHPLSEPQQKPILETLPKPQLQSHYQPPQESNPQPQPQASSQTQPQPVTQSVPQTQPQPQPTFQSTPQVQPQPISQSTLQAQTQPSSQSKHQAQTQPLYQSTPQTQPQSISPSTPQTQPQPKIQTQLQPQPTSKITTPQAQPQPISQSTTPLPSQSIPQTPGQRTHQLHSETKPQPTPQPKHQVQHLTQPHIKIQTVSQLQVQPTPQVTRLKHPHTPQLPENIHHIKEALPKIYIQSPQPQFSSTTPPQKQPQAKITSDLQITTKSQLMPKSNTFFPQPETESLPKSNFKHQAPAQSNTETKPQPKSQTRDPPQLQPLPKNQATPVPHSQPVSQPNPPPKTKIHSQPEHLPKQHLASRPSPQPHPRLQFQPQTTTYSGPTKVTPWQAVSAAPSPPEEGKPLPRPTLATEKPGRYNHGSGVLRPSVTEVPHSHISSSVRSAGRSTTLPRIRMMGPIPPSKPGPSKNSSTSGAANGARHRGSVSSKRKVWNEKKSALRPVVPKRPNMVGPNMVGKNKDHDKPFKQGEKESILKPFPRVTAKPKPDHRRQTATSAPTVNSSRFDRNENPLVFSSLPASEVDIMGKKRFVAPHVVYKTGKGLNEPCSITSSLTHFPDEEGSDQNVTAPPRVPPSNVTVVTVEGCSSFIILDWQKSDNETREYEVLSKTKGPNGQEMSILTTNQTHTAVENLKPEKSYEFTVTPKNELGTGPSSDPVSFSTESADPRVSEYVSGKDAIWTQFPFKADAYSECSGKQFVKRTWYRKFVGIQLCNSLRYKIYLSDSLNGKFYNIGDQTGYGEDHCQFVDSFLDGRTGSRMLADQLPSRPGFFRALRQEPVHFGEIGGKSHVTYVGWYECGTPIPGKW